MSGKKEKGAKVLKRPMERKQEASPGPSMDSSNQSTFNHATFVEGLKLKNCDAPLHSTALEEDLNPSVEEQVDKGGAGRRDFPKKSTSKQRGVVAKRAEASGGEEPVKKKKKKRANEDLDVRVVESEQVDRKAATSQEGAKTNSKKGRSPAGSESGVVIDALDQFCEKYRKSVESQGVAQSIDAFFRTVQEQLLEKMSSSKDLQVLRRKNSKGGSLIRSKTKRLLTVKNSLITARSKLGTTEKEEAQLKKQLSDLRRGLGFLCNITELTSRYRDHRLKHPKRKETYGASSLPALLLEAKHCKCQKKLQEKKTAIDEAVK